MLIIESDLVKLRRPASGPPRLRRSRHPLRRGAGQPPVRQSGGAGLLHGRHRRGHRRRDEEGVAWPGSGPFPENQHQGVRQGLRARVEIGRGKSGPPKRTRPRRTQRRPSPSAKGKKKRTGVFVCHCGTNIAATVDVAKVAKEMAGEDSVASRQGLRLHVLRPGPGAVIQAIKDNKLDSVVVTCCSPNLHEKTFRDNAKRAGINNFTCEIANIREQCSWVHKDKAKATEKAIQISRSVVRRVSRNESLEPIARSRHAAGTGDRRRDRRHPGGARPRQRRLSRSCWSRSRPTIGGHMLQLSETFPTLDCSQCILSPKMVEVSKHPQDQADDL